MIYVDKGQWPKDPESPYRFALWRRLENGGPVLLFVMLNPSTANAEEDDPTLKKCVSYAKREGFAEVRIVNLFAWRSPHPKELAVDWVRSIGNPDNDQYIQMEAIIARKV